MLTGFGKLCKKIRIDHNEILADMACKLNVSSAALSAVEHGKKNVPGKWIDTLSREYCLSEEEEKQLREAAFESRTSVKIQISGRKEDDRNLIISFARNFDSLTDEDREKIRKVLKK